MSEDHILSEPTTPETSGSMRIRHLAIPQAPKAGRITATKTIEIVQKVTILHALRVQVEHGPIT